MGEGSNPALGMILFALVLVCEKYFLPETKNIFFGGYYLSLEKKLADKLDSDDIIIYYPKIFIYSLSATSMKSALHRV